MGVRSAVEITYERQKKTCVGSLIEAAKLRQVEQKFLKLLKNPTRSYVQTAELASILQMPNVGLIDIPDISTGEIATLVLTMEMGRSSGDDD